MTRIINFFLSFSTLYFLICFVFFLNSRFFFLLVKNMFLDANRCVKLMTDNQFMDIINSHIRQLKGKLVYFFFLCLPLYRQMNQIASAYIMYKPASSLLLVLSLCVFLNKINSLFEYIKCSCSEFLMKHQNLHFLQRTNGSGGTTTICLVEKNIMHNKMRVR